jgi:hypothetical protein
VDIRFRLVLLALSPISLSRSTQSIKGKKMKILLALTLALTLACTACSPAFVTTVDTIISVAAPALINIVEIVAVSKGTAVDPALVAKVTTDAANIKTLVGDFASASSIAAPGVCSQLQAAISTYQADQVMILSTAQVSDPATQTKITLLSSLIGGTVQGILAALPQCSASKAAFVGAKAPLSVSNFVSAYNAILVSKTGNASIDALTAKRKLHEHGKVVRYATFGLLK